jgi:hypothetical protein
MKKLEMVKTAMLKKYHAHYVIIHTLLSEIIRNMSSVFISKSGTDATLAIVNTAQHINLISKYTLKVAFTQKI